MRVEAEQMKKELTLVKTKMEQVQQKDKQEIQMLRQDLLKTKSKLRGHSNIYSGDSLVEKLQDDLVHFQLKLKESEDARNRILKESRESADAYREEIVRLKDQMNRNQTKNDRITRNAQDEVKILREDLAMLRQKLRDTEASEKSSQTATNLENDVKNLKAEIQRLRNELRQSEEREEMFSELSSQAEEAGALRDQLDEITRSSRRKYDEMSDQVRTLQNEVERYSVELRQAHDREKKMLQNSYDEEKHLHDYVRQLKEELEQANTKIRDKEAMWNDQKEENLRSIELLRTKLAEAKRKNAEDTKKASDLMDKTLNVALDRNDELQAQIVLMTKESEKAKVDYQNEKDDIERQFNEEIEILRGQIQSDTQDRFTSSAVQGQILSLQSELSKTKQKLAITQKSKDQALDEAREEILRLRAEADRLTEELRESRMDSRHRQEKSALEASHNVLKTTQEIACMQNEVQGLTLRLKEVEESKEALQKQMEIETKRYMNEIKELRNDKAATNAQRKQYDNTSEVLQGTVEKLQHDLLVARKRLQEADEVKSVMEHSRTIEVDQHCNAMKTLQKEIATLKTKLEEKSHESSSECLGLAYDEIVAQNEKMKEHIADLQSKLNQTENDLEDEMDNHLKDSDMWMMEMEKVKRKLLSEQERMKEELNLAKERMELAEQREKEERNKMQLTIEEAKVKAKEEAEEVLQRQAAALAERVEQLREKAAYWSNLLKEEKIKAVEEGRRASEALAATEAAALEAVNRTLTPRTGRPTIQSPLNGKVNKKKTSWFGME